MDDFEKEYPGFDWKNIPARKHPGGKNCPCPKHEYIREQYNNYKTMRKHDTDINFTLKFCPEHYDIYYNMAIPSLPLRHRVILKLALRVGVIKIVKLTHMQSDICFYCKFGSGGFDKKTELPPVQ